MKLCDRCLKPLSIGSPKKEHVGCRAMRRVHAGVLHRAERVYGLLLSVSQDGNHKEWLARLALEDFEALVAHATCGPRTASREFILCAAVWMDDGKAYSHQPRNIETGMVFSGWRHHNCFVALARCYPDEGLPHEEIAKLHAGRTNGFLTSKGNFFDREESAKIATEAGQISAPVDSLHSEDLY